jgi:hypothetical protein
MKDRLSGIEIEGRMVASRSRRFGWFEVISLKFRSFRVICGRSDPTVRRAAIGVVA